MSRQRKNSKRKGRQIENYEGRQTEKFNRQRKRQKRRREKYDEEIEKGKID